VLITDGRVTGYLDLGELGLADRWWDIAIGGWSTTWNVDPKWEPLFYVFRHYVSRGEELGRTFRATTSPVGAGQPQR